jgi:hypothetical protein
MATAIASLHRYGSHLGRRIRPHGEPEEAYGQQQIQPNPKKNAAQAFHARSFRLAQKKTDSTRLPKIFVTRVGVRSELEGYQYRNRFPF